jgi:hypothetical protein
MEALKKKYL